LALRAFGALGAAGLQERLDLQGRLGDGGVHGRGRRRDDDHDVAFIDDVSHG